MSGKIKVAGYSQKIQYDGGIEYRPFSGGLVGNQFDNNGETTLFTSGNFNITTNLDLKEDKIFNLDSFSNLINLDDLKGELIEDKLFLNFDKKEIKNYSYFGSFREFIRVSLENIIVKWPASLFVSPINKFNAYLSGATYQNYSFDIINGISSFDVNIDRINNKFNINYSISENEINKINKENPLRNLIGNYNQYVVSIGDIDYNIVGLLFNDDYISLKVEGDLFNLGDGKMVYHIKPNKSNIEQFFYNLTTFEKHLLNREITPKYTAVFNYNVESELGDLILSEKNITWPTSDGYNIDFDSDAYVNYVSELLELANSSDDLTSDIISRFLVSESIKDFDTIDQKISNVLKIYGRNFDEVKFYIDNIPYVNTVTYDSINNTPNLFIKNLAKTLGWTLFQNDDLRFDTELWKKLIINSHWVWSSKGTRKVIEFLTKLIGLPEGLVKINEFVYIVKKQLDYDLLSSLNSEFNSELVELNFDADGFPLLLPNSNASYFQKAGLWYQENSQHKGIYDGGNEYFNQLKNLIPNFSATTLVTETISSYQDNLFVNNGYGKFCLGSDVPSISSESNCFTINSNLISVDREVILLDDCGCEINDCPGVLEINISPIEVNLDCGYNGFTLDVGGLVLFSLYDDTTTFFMDSECCLALGFTPELLDGIYVCRWDRKTDLCSDYVPSSIMDGYQVFLNNEGVETYEVPSASCCPVNTTPELQINNSYKCALIELPIIEDIVWADTYTIENRTGTNQVVDIYSNNDPGSLSMTFQTRNGNGGWVDNPILVDTGNSNFELLIGVNEFRLKINFGGTFLFSNVLRYTRIV